MFSRLIAAAVLAAGLTPAAMATTTNPIVNGDFEAGNTGFTSDYFNTLLSGGPRGGLQTYQVAPHINAAFSGIAAQGTRGGDHTTGSGLALFVNGDNRSTTAFWRQTVTVATSGTYAFSLFGTLWFGGASAQSLAVDGVAAGAFTILTPRDQWQPYSVTFDTNGATTFDLALFNLSNQFSGNDFAIDDISLSLVTADPSPVPLPASLPLLLLGLGALGAIRRQRRG